MSQTFLDLIQSIGIIFTIGFSLYQIFRTNQITKIQINQTLSSHLTDLNQLMVQNADLYAVFEKSYNKSKYSREQEKALMVVYRYVNLFDEAQYYKKHKMISQSSWNAWLRTMKRRLSLAFFQSAWQNMRLEYEVDFQELIDKIVLSNHRKEP